MKTCLFLLFLPLLCLAQEQLGGRVLDAETGESLPYAMIYAETGRGTLTNLDGEFLLSVSPDEELTFSFVGYEKLRMKASQLTPVVRMKPLSQEMEELIVTPVDETALLKQLIKNLKQDFARHEDDEQAYFMRAMLSGVDDTYLMEGLAKAASAVNVRNIAMVSGTKGLNEQGDSSRMDLQFTNVQLVAGIAPVTYNSGYWTRPIKPLLSLKDTRNYYNTTVVTLKGKGDTRLYKITFRWKEKKRPEWQQKDLVKRRRVTGTAYVDAASLRLLRFEGKVENAFQMVQRERRHPGETEGELELLRQPSDIRFHLSYDYSQGYAAVSRIAVRGGNEDMGYSILMFSLHDRTLFRDVEGYSSYNIVSSLESAGYDPSLWQKYNIVKRTKAEEKAAFGQANMQKKK